MSIPSFDRFIDPLLRLLTQHPEGIRAADAQRVLAEGMGITPEARRQLLPSGGYPVYKSRIGWAHDRLKREGLSSSVRRGFWCITAQGLDYAARHPTLPGEEIQRIARPAADSRVGSSDAPRTDEETALSPAVTSPVERIHQAIADLRENLRAELLDRILARDPAFFEVLVLQLLKAMGYGTEAGALEHSGNPGDDGIDGIISLDQLGLDRVYVQAKRYARDRRVQKEAIHGFIGALHLKGANKGVFITTGGFTAGAGFAAREVRGLNLRLIDGEELTRLMIDHQVGVRHEAQPVPKTDLDFWEEE